MQQEKTIKKIEKAKKKLGGDASHREIAREAGVSRPAVKAYFRQQDESEKPMPQTDESLQDKSKRKLSELVDDDNATVALSAAKKGADIAEPPAHDRQMSPAVRDMILADATIKSGIWQGVGDCPEYLQPVMKEQAQYEDTSTFKK